MYMLPFLAVKFPFNCYAPSVPHFLKMLLVAQRNLTGNQSSQRET